MAEVVFKVEPDFLISFLNSSIESLEKCKDNEINGIMPKEELLERLREKKISMERMYLDNSERDADSSLSFSQSLGDKYSSKHSAPHSQEHRPHSPPHTKRLDSSKKSISSPSMGTTMPLMISESPSMGSMQVQSPQTSQPPTQSAAAQTVVPAQNKVNDIAQDNSITSEPSETTTTTTTTSEDVVTTYKEPSLKDCSSASYSQSKQNGSLKDNVNNNNSSTTERVSKDKAVKGEGQHIKQLNGDGDSKEEKLNDKSEASDNVSGEGAETANEEVKGEGANSVENSQALDSEDSTAALQQQLHAAAAAAALVHGSYSKPNLKVESSDVYQIVDVIRRNTNLSFDLSCEALRVVLTSLEQLYNGAINPYLEAVAIHVTDKVETPKGLLGMTHDSKRLQYIFSQLADCKNDAEQRTWMLYEDEDDIVQFLEELVEILNNADETISCYEMSCDQYQALVNLVQYYQMETRWPIKRLLLKTFTAACHLDHIIVDILLTSVLPLEIVEDMKTNFSNLDRFKQLVKMLTIIFCLGQPMPVNHQGKLKCYFKFLKKMNFE
ncbi:uncharacterized protein LOC124418997 [Lucilia cuprina]|uniref:uncharacterized protein LOC124418997 n=1 Tax=Lucilia cuprina TaxID=7375 RepID=UPI001F056B43|nr:uncharacterized protein LOC124418997 [Lucilia cuprina]